MIKKNQLLVLGLAGALLAGGALGWNEYQAREKIRVAEQELRCDAIRTTLMSWISITEERYPDFVSRKWSTESLTADTPEMDKLVREIFQRADLCGKVPVEKRRRYSRDYGNGNPLVDDRTDREAAIWKIAQPICITIPGISSKL